MSFNDMTVVEKLEALNKKKQALNAEFKSAEKEFAVLIVDKNVPLVERWKIFCAAPDEIKHHDCWLPTRGAGLEYAINQFCNAPEIYGRGKKIDTAKMFEECVHEGKLYPENFTEYKSTKTPEEIEALLIDALEQILSMNLGSFCYDW